MKRKASDHKNTFVTPIFSKGICGKFVSDLINAEGGLFADVLLSYDVRNIETSTLSFKHNVPRTNLGRDVFLSPREITINENERSFDGFATLNKASFSVEGIPAVIDILIFGLAIYPGALSKIPNLIFHFPEPFESSKLPNIPSLKGRVLPIEKNSLSVHWGMGTYAPLPGEILKKNEEPITGCPFGDPSTCKYKEKTEKCAFSNKDNVCTKVVGMTATVDLTPSSGFGGIS